MPSNNELIAEAVKLAGELNLEVTTDGLDNKGLGALVSDLKAKKKDAELKTQADEAAAAAAEAEAKAKADAEAAPKRAPGVYVADGKAVTSKIGILTGGKLVEAKHFSGGQTTLDHLVKRGHCVKVK